MTTAALQTTDYRQIFLSGVPMIDLRAPCEFEAGAFVHSVNLPLMLDPEREQVGTCYKKQGREAAILLGHQLVSGEIKAQRMESWLAFARQNPHGYLYCFRGGLRSQTVQAWMREVGVDYPLITGGYKALRRFLINETQRIAEQRPMYILSGLTGVGKTPLLCRFKQAVDLEGLANHRGSSFGRQLTPQPSQINFENRLAEGLLKIDQQQSEFILLEDESRLIGARSLPLEFHRQMTQAPIIVLQAGFETRVENIYREYVVDRFAQYQAALSASPINALAEYLRAATAGIRKRLGNERFTLLQNLIDQAIGRQAESDDFSGHYDWIRLLLAEYYDPMYQYQLSKKRQRVIFSGSSEEVCDFIDSLS